MARRRSARAAAANSEFATGLTEAGSILQAVRIFQVEDSVRENLFGLSDVAARRQLLTEYISGVVSVAYQGFALLLMVLGLGIVYAVDVTGFASLGAVVLIMLRSLTYAQGVQVGIQNLYQHAPYAAALNEERDRYLANAVRQGGQELPSIGALAFENVTYEYEPNRPVLQDISFRTHRGESIGIVGPSGFGQVHAGADHPRSARALDGTRDR